ncbi:MAG: glycosyltransferase family 4 protein, partial [Myxococcota bacterium]|nr:glycosyltransferase family 4 protein [Myxococcota bacterium]
MRAPLRIAMVGLRAPWGTEGGVEHAVGALAPRLADRGCAVTVYCRRRYNTLGPGIHRGVRLVDVDTVYSKHAEAFLHTALAAPRAALSADLVHVHATGPALFSWMPRLLRRKVVATVHGLDWKRQKWGLMARTVLRAGAWSAARWPDETIVVGQHLADAFATTYGRATTVVRNGVDPILRQPLDASGVEGLEPGRYLLYVGRLVPEKGLDRLFDAYAASGIDLPLVVTGGATHAEEYGAALEAKAPPGVRLTGPRHGSARDALLSHARAFVLPSLLEGFPLAPLEAMASGLPVMLSDIPPHRELLDEDLDGAAGWVVPDDGWPDALRRVAAMEPDMLSVMGDVG